VTLTPHPLLVPWSRKSRAIPLLPLWAVRPVQSLSACTRVDLPFYFNDDTLCYKDIFELNPRISLICSLFCALITCIHCIKDQPMHFNIVYMLWSPKCFGHSCGHLQGDYFENKDAVALKMCVNHSAIPSSSSSGLQRLDYNSPRISAIYITPHTPNSCNFIYFFNY